MQNNIYPFKGFLDCCEITHVSTDEITTIFYGLEKI